MPTDITTLGIAVDSTDVVKADQDLDNFSNAAERAGNEAQDFGDKSKAAATKTKALGATANTATGKMGGLSAKAGQAGIQIQQLVGQVQGGTSAFTALSQQGADLGFVLGAPLVGVIVSLGAVLAGTLAPALIGAKIDAEELEQEISDLTDSFKEATEAQVAFYRIESLRRQTDLTEEIERQREKLADLRKEYEELETVGENVQVWGAAAGATINRASLRYGALNEEIVTLSAAIDTNIQKLDKERESLDSVSAGLGLAKDEADNLARPDPIIDDNLFAAYSAYADFRIQAEAMTATEIDTINQSILSGYIEYADARVQAELGANDRILSGYMEYQQARVEGEQWAAEEALRIKQIEEQNKFKISQSFDSLFRTLMQAESKELFEIGKVGAASKAAVDAYGAINATLALGGAFAAPAAFAIGAAAFANVAKILSTPYGGKGGGAGSAPSIPPPQQQGGDTIQNTEVSISISGNADQDVVNQLEELFKNDAVIIPRNSAQGRALR